MKQNDNTSTNVRIKVYSVQEVAQLYGISGKRLKKWLNPFEKEIGHRNGHFYNPKQIKIIFDRLGDP